MIYQNWRLSLVSVLALPMIGWVTRNLGKTNALNDNDLVDFVKLQRTFANSDKSWSVEARNLDPRSLDLSVKNPLAGGAVAHRSPAEILAEIEALDAEGAEALEGLRALL